MLGRLFGGGGSLREKVDAIIRKSDKNPEKISPHLEKLLTENAGTEAEKTPDFAHLLYWVAISRVSLGNYGPALAAFEECIEAFDRQGHNKVGAVYPLACLRMGEMLRDLTEGNEAMIRSLAVRGGAALVETAKSNISGASSCLVEMAALFDHVDAGEECRQFLEGMLEQADKQFDQFPDGYASVAMVLLERMDESREGHQILARGQRALLALKKYGEEDCFPAAQITAACAFAMEELGQGEGAIDFLRHQIALPQHSREKNPSNFCLLALALAEMLMCRNQHGEAMALVRQAEDQSRKTKEMEPFLAQALSTKVRGQAALGQTNEAMAAVDELVQWLDRIQVDKEQEDAKQTLISEIAVCARCLAGADRFDCALKVVSKLRARASLIFGTHNEDYLRALSAEATAVAAEGDHRAAEEILYECLELLDDENKLITPIHAEILKELGAAYAESNRFEEAEAILNNALTMILEKGEEESTSVGYVIACMARLKMREGALEEAAALFERAKEILEPRNSFFGRVTRHYKECAALA